ncbi:MAG: hypothetical protein K2N95_15740 [Lachnospiraceae bacterium]|nr:hypothetical protein [Lachnospiraceae bacterium]
MKVFLCGGGAGIQTIEANKRLNEVIDHSKPCSILHLMQPFLLAVLVSVGILLLLVRDCDIDQGYAVFESP